ncbi:MAG: hypothetical protein ACRC33_19475, partial [Gemmataceae bacterium]
RSGLHAEPTRYELDADDPVSRAALGGLVFAWTPIGWGEWVECWRKDQDGEGNPGLGPVAESLVLGVGKKLPPSVPEVDLNAGAGPEARRDAE